MTNDKSNIIVSICCITYNHASFIRKALDGFLMQEPPTGVSADEPWYEILIHDDASTDGTTEIIKEYAAKYPDKVFPLYERENQYSKGHIADIDMYNYKRAKGKYIAYCEGDDFWIIPDKLKRQIDFMESHLDYSICFHDYKVYDEREKQMYWSKDALAFREIKHLSPDGTDISLDEYFNGLFGQPLTMIFRLSSYDFKWYKRYKYYRDTHEIYHLLKAGKGYWMNFDGGVHIRHQGGVAGGLTRLDFCYVSLPIDREFFWKTLDPHAKQQYLGTLNVCVRLLARDHLLQAIWCMILSFLLTGHPHSIKRNIEAIKNARK